MKALVIGLLFLVPAVSFASDDAIKASVLSKLLDQFVAQVNLIDSIQKEIDGATDKSQFTKFQDAINQQLAFTTNQIATLLNPETPPVNTTPAVGGNTGNGDTGNNNGGNTDNGGGQNEPTPDPEPPVQPVVDTFTAVVEKYNVTTEALKTGYRLGEIKLEPNDWWPPYPVSISNVTVESDIPVFVYNKSTPLSGSPFFHSDHTLRFVVDGPTVPGVYTVKVTEIQSDKTINIDLPIVFTFEAE